MAHCKKRGIRYAAPETYVRMKPKVFISYSRDDAAFVKKLRMRLKQAKLSTWLDVEGLKPGTQWQPELEKALRTASAMVVCLSPRSANSSFVTFEWSYAMGAGVKVFPVLAEETPMHPWLSRFQWIDLSGKNPPWHDLLGSLKTVPRSRRSARRSPPKQRAKHPVEHAHASAKQSVGPKLVARFELEDRTPVENGDDYSIALAVRDAPPGTKYVTYELHDDSFDEPRFRINNSEPEFEGWISSYGDVRVSARGTRGKRSWTTHAMLGEALRRGHRTDRSEAIEQAIETIENN
jgi:hypothetical protein